MKSKPSPTTVKSGSYLFQALMRGLNKKQRQWAQCEIYRYEEIGEPIAWGKIRNQALEK